MTNIKLKGSDLLKQEIRSHEEAVALMQQGGILMTVGWWAKAKAIEYLVKESGLSLNKWHIENLQKFLQLGTRSSEAQRQQSWQEVKWLDTNGVSENDLPKIENHAYRLRKIDNADKLSVWQEFVSSDSKTPKWDKVEKRPSYDKGRNWDDEFKDVDVKTNKDELFALSKLLIDENQAALVKMIVEYMRGFETKRGAINKVLNELCNE